MDIVEEVKWFVIYLVDKKIVLVILVSYMLWVKDLFNV